MDIEGIDYDENNCEHKHIITYFRFYGGTYYEPPEWDWRNHCKDCGEWIDDNDIPENAEIEEIDVAR